MAWLFSVPSETDSDLDGAGGWTHTVPISYNTAIFTGRAIADRDDFGRLAVRTEEWSSSPFACRPIG